MRACVFVCLPIGENHPREVRPSRHPTARSVPPETSSVAIERVRCQMESTCADSSVPAYTRSAMRSCDAHVYVNSIVSQTPIYPSVPPEIRYASWSFESLDGQALAELCRELKRVIELVSGFRSAAQRSRRMTLQRFFPVVESCERRESGFS